MIMGLDTNLPFIIAVLYTGVLLFETLNNFFLNLFLKLAIRRKTLNQIFIIWKNISIFFQLFIIISSTEIYSK